jgi:hypothetical protein
LEPALTLLSSLPRLARSSWLPWLGAGLCSALATWARLRQLALVIPDRDAIAPFATAWALLDGRLPLPHHAHFGDGLWLCHLPLVAVAGSLEQLFALRALVGAGAAACGFAAAWLLAGDQGWRRLWAGLTAGVLLAWDPGLVDSFISGARGYWAPELMALAVLGAAGAARGRSWGLPLLLGGALLAAHHHPLALGCAAGLLLFALPAWRATRGRGRRVALALAVVLVGLPLLRLLLGRPGSAGGVEGLEAVALGSSSASTLEGLPLALAALRDWAWLDYGLGWWLLPGGLLLALDRRVAWAALLGLLGLVVLGLGIQHLDPHHLRMAAAPVVVAAAMGWARLGPGALAAGALALGLWRPPPYVGLPVGALSTLDTMAPVVAQQEGPLWLDRAGVSAGCTDSTGLVLSMVLQDLPTAALRLDPRAPVLLACCGEPPPGGVELWRKDRVALLRIDSLTTAHAWAQDRGGVPAGDAADWGRMLGQPPLGAAVTRWWEPAWSTAPPPR